jgi:hypothetical protein
MWTVRAPVKFGPRPGQPDNIVALDYLEWYDEGDRALALDAYRARGYTHAVSGPPIDVFGYHNQYPTEAGPMSQAIWDRQMNALEMLTKAGLAPIFFLHPDGWTFEQTRDTFTPYLQQPRSQQLIRIIVPTGWEPTRYDWSSKTWAAFLQWAKDVLPNALRLIHTVSDVDAPVGTDERFNDNDPTQNPKGNAGGWDRVAPLLHGWLIQNGPYTSAPDTPPANVVGSDGRTLAQNFEAQFKSDGIGAEAHSVAWHFKSAGGWTRDSAWGAGIPICLYNAECTSYEEYWHDEQEAVSRQWGDLAMAGGADGYLDGGTVEVPRRKDLP